MVILPDVYVYTGSPVQAAVTGSATGLFFYVLYHRYCQYAAVVVVVVLYVILLLFDADTLCSACEIKRQSCSAAVAHARTSIAKQDTRFSRT